NKRWSMASSNAFRFSGLSLVIVATAPSMSSLTLSSPIGSDLVAQLVLQHLAAGVERQRVDENDATRHLEVGHSFAAPLDELVVSDLGGVVRWGAAHDERDADFAEAMIGDTHDGDLAHRRMRHDHVLDLGRIRVESAD